MRPKKTMTELERSERLKEYDLQISISEYQLFVAERDMEVETAEAYLKYRKTVQECKNNVSEARTNLYRAKVRRKQFLKYHPL